jgi:hypothetical protein
MVWVLVVLAYIYVVMGDGLLLEVSFSLGRPVFLLLYVFEESEGGAVVGRLNIRYQGVGGG